MYTLASKIESAQTNTGIEINIQLGRPLNEKEKQELSSFAEDFYRTMNRNTRLQDTKEIQNIIDEKEVLLACFPLVPIYVKDIANGYSSDAVNPWYLVTTPKGVIKIGWRKRVIYIGWEDSDISLAATTLFPTEDVTKYDKVIHAWGYEKAKEYLHKLLN